MKWFTTKAEKTHHELKECSNKKCNEPTYDDVCSLCKADKEVYQTEGVTR